MSWGGRLGSKISDARILSVICGANHHDFDPKTAPLSIRATPCGALGAAPKERGSDGRRGALSVWRGAVVGVERSPPVAMALPRKWHPHGAPARAHLLIATRVTNFLVVVCVTSALRHRFRQGRPWSHDCYTAQSADLTDTCPNQAEHRRLVYESNRRVSALRHAPPRLRHDRIRLISCVSRLRHGGVREFGFSRVICGY